MSVANNPAQVYYVGSNSPGPFSFGFYVLSPAELVVTRYNINGVPTSLSPGAGYTLNSLTASGGSLTLSSSLTAGQRLKIRRSTILSQTTSYTENGPFAAKDHEAALDKLTLIVQDLYTKFNYTLRFSSDMWGSAVDEILPLNAGKIISVNEAGNGLVFFDASTYITDIVALAEQYRDEAASSASAASGSASMAASSATAASNSANSSAESASQSASSATVANGSKEAAVSAALEALQLSGEAASSAATAATSASAAATSASNAASAAAAAGTSASAAAASAESAASSKTDAEESAYNSQVYAINSEESAGTAQEAAATVTALLGAGIISAEVNSNGYLLIHVVDDSTLSDVEINSSGYLIFEFEV